MLSRTLLTALINSLWQATLVAAVATLGARLLRSAPARFHHRLWVAAMAFSGLLTASTLLRRTPAEAVRLSPAAARVATRPGIDAASEVNLRAFGSQGAVEIALQGRPRTSWLGASLRRRSRTVSLPPYSVCALAGAYFLFLLYRLVRLRRAWMRTEAIRAGACSRAMPDAMASVAARCQAALGLPVVPILCSPEVQGPLTLGVRRPAIILPESLFQSARPAELMATLCHEMAHIRRHDFLMNLVYELVLLPLSFHPAARLMKRRIDQTRELACDEMASGCIVDASCYARSLVSLARAMANVTSSALSSQPSLGGPGYTLSVFDANILEERIMRLLDTRPRASARTATIALLAGVLLLAATSAASFAFCLTVTTPAKAAAEESMAHSRFSGRWELDKTRSVLPSPSPNDFVQAIELRDSQVRITTTSKDWTIQKPIAITLFALTIPELSTRTDNGETVQKYGPGELWSKTGWRGDNLVTDWTLAQKGQAEVTGTWMRSLSPDGQTQTLEVKARDPRRGAEGKATLVFVKRSEPLESFLGAWVGKYEGATYVIATLRMEQGKLAGTVSLGNFGVDREGQVNNVKDQPEPAHAQPIVDWRLEGDTLHLTTRPPGGKDNAFEMRPGGDNELKVKWSPPGLLPGAPVPGWWKVTREPENSEPLPGGPVGGVGGGVIQGVKAGVPGGITGSVTGGVVDGVTGSVPGDVLPGAPRDDAQPAVPTISGTVFDPSGARVPNAIVSVKQKVIGPEQTSSVEFAETTVADDVGEFSFKGVAPGHYQLEVSKPGFAVFRQQLEIKPGSAVYQGKVIHPGPLEILIELTPGEVLENVEVTALAPPDSAAKSPSSAPRRIRVGGLVQRTKLVEQTKPEYPESARAKGIQGVVLLQAVISKEGQPYSLNVLNSPDPALSEAARRAVEQWRYEPTLLNGEPIEVATTIAVRFHLEP